MGGLFLHKKDADRRPQMAGRKKTRPMALCVRAVPSLFGQSGADRRKAQDGCQNGQLWLGGPLCYSATAYARIMTGFLLESR